MKNINKVLVIGNNVRNIVCSARKAGYIVYALDNFGDVDLHKCATRAQMPINLSESELQDLVESFADVDAVILGTGFEQMKFRSTLNNSPEISQLASDKSKLPVKLRSIGIPHPATCNIEKAESLGFPLIVKPISGSGGIRNEIIKNEEQLGIFRKRSDSYEFIAQEFVEGIPCSASIISTGDDAVVVALNEQLIGLPWLTKLPFAYCGNITPFHSEFNDEMVEYAKKIALEFKLLGSNGVDFILTENGVFVIEINPRFQGSLDTVELSTGLNIFDAHIKSFAGELPEPGEPYCFAARAIIFAQKELLITEEIHDTLINCMNKGRAADIPGYGVAIRPDEPLTTVLATARTRMKVLDKARKASHYVKRRTEV